MTRSLLAFLLIGSMAAPAAAQGRGNRSGRVPPGHMPPPGECRVWYDGVPPGHQPEPMSCWQAERVAARDRNARVIYGRGTWRIGADDGWWGRDDERRDRRRERTGRRDDRDERARGDDDRDRRDRGRAVPRTEQEPTRGRNRRIPDSRRPRNR